MSENLPDSLQTKLDKTKHLILRIIKVYGGSQNLSVAHVEAINNLGINTGMQRAVSVSFALRALKKLQLEITEKMEVAAAAAAAASATTEYTHPPSCTFPVHSEVQNGEYCCTDSLIL